MAGHTAVVINDKGNKGRHSRMVAIFGHSPRYGYVNVVQEFHFGKSVESSSIRTSQLSVATSNCLQEVEFGILSPPKGTLSAEATVTRVRGIL